MTLDLKCILIYDTKSTSQKKNQINWIHEYYKLVIKGHYQESKKTTRILGENVCK